MINRVVFLGEKASGKSSMSIKWTTGEFKDGEPQPTNELGPRNIKKIAGEAITIWDLSGDHGINDDWIKDSRMIVFFCDASKSVDVNEKSIRYWQERAKKVALNASAILVFTKIDLEDALEDWDMNNLGIKFNLKVVKTSARKNEGLDSFEDAVFGMMKKQRAQVFEQSVLSRPVDKDPKKQALLHATNYVKGDFKEGDLCLKLRSDKTCSGFLDGFFHRRTKKLLKKAFDVSLNESKIENPDTQKLLSAVCEKRKRITLSSEKYRASEKIAKILVLNECEKLLLKKTNLKDFTDFLSHNSGYKKSFGSSNTDKLVVSIMQHVELLERDLAQAPAVQVNHSKSP